MNTYTHRLITLAGLLIMFAVTTVHAQTGPAIRAEIPFGFVAGEKHFEPGRYLVKEYSPRTLLIQDSTGQAGCFVQTASPITASYSKESVEKLVFLRTGDQYVLSEAWLTRGSDGSKVAMSSARRREMRRVALADHRTSAQTVEIIATVASR